MCIVGGRIGWIVTRSGIPGTTTQEGLRMSQSKIQLVLDFLCPTVSKQLKSFLGLVNYSCDFIRNQSTIVRPLHALLTNYQRTKRIVWTSEATSAFDEIKEQVSKCTTTNFISDVAVWGPRDLGPDSVSRYT